MTTAAVLPTQYAEGIKPDKLAHTLRKIKNKEWNFVLMKRLKFLSIGLLIPKLIQYKFLIWKMKSMSAASRLELLVWGFTPKEALKT